MADGADITRRARIARANGDREEFLRCYEEAKALVLARAKLRERKAQVKQEAWEARGEKVVFPKAFSSEEISRRERELLRSLGLLEAVE
jgi:hypothetical protein